VTWRLAVGLIDWTCLFVRPPQQAGRKGDGPAGKQQWALALALSFLFSILSFVALFSPAATAAVAIVPFSYHFAHFVAVV
jgi:hypothetical protein